MNYQEWIEHTKKAIHQYDEGAVNADEVFNTVVNAATEVDTGREEYKPTKEDLEALIADAKKQLKAL